MSNTFCILPWINISVDPDGSVKPCCISTDYITKNTGQKYNLGYDRIDTIVNSSDFIKIRQDMIDGKPISGCKQCYTQEASGGKSQRMLHNTQWMVPDKSYHEVIEPVIEYFDLRFGNMCNLSCRSCFPGYSSQMAKDVESNEQLTKFHPILTEDLNQWYTTETYRENIEGQFDNIRQLYITGGEPTIIQENYKLLESLIQSGKHSNITLLINTNMTNLQGKWVDLLKQFKSVILFPSVDGVGDMQEYLRYPSNWEQIERNFSALIGLNLPNVQIRPTPVIQIANLNKIVDLFEYYENFNRIAKRRVVDIMPIILESPPYMNMVNLPVSYKHECMVKIREWIATKCRYQGPTFHIRMKSLSHKCQEDPNMSELSRFFEYNDILDKQRGESLSNVNVDLWSLR
jgi:sulfatase maturation enzyme AslB (radical SAM superfamily)